MKEALSVEDTLKLALDLATMHHSDDGYAELRSKVRRLAKEALAQPEQEPVAWGMRNDGGQIYDCITPMEHLRIEGEYTVPLYTTPPQRTWVGLTDEQMRQICGSVPTMREAVREAEAILKDGNT